MKKTKRLLSFLLTAALCLSVLCYSASAKTVPNGQTVGTVLFYVTNSDGEDVLISHIPVAEMETDMRIGLIDDTNHNYSVLDRYVTTVHQEAQGFTAPEFIAYAQAKSTLPELRALDLRFDGQDRLSFWEIDQGGYDELDTYTYDDLYGVPRYNFPLLYEYWNYRTQDYYDPAGKMSREQVIDYIFDHGEPEGFLLSVRAFSQRYQTTGEKYGAGDYNMENYWESLGLPDNQRALRMMVPMTEQELRDMTPTASNSRYWCANIRLTMAEAPEFPSLGTVEAPTAVMTEDKENYYIDFFCETPGATVLYNQNFLSVTYTPTQEYSPGEAVAVPKSWFRNGPVTINCRAVKDGYTDPGVTTLVLEASGKYTPPAWQNPWTDVPKSAWYYENVEYVTREGLFDAVGEGRFAPEAPMTRAMLVTALYRMAGSPRIVGGSGMTFADVAPSAPYADAVAWCRAAGVVNGVSDAEFQPEATITREQIVTMFHRYAEKVAGADMTTADDLAAFADADKLASWSRAQMQWAIAAGLINGMTADTLVPQGTATRAQTAALVQRLAAYIDG